MSRSFSSSVVASLTLAGRTWGEVRRLQAFDKKRHTVPDQVNGATQAFLAKLCASEIAEEGERLFQSCRSAFGYKRKDLALSASVGATLLETRDFALELRCELDPDDPSRYFLETEASRVASRDLLESDEFAEGVGPRFDRLRCAFAGGASVTAVIDAIEEDSSGELSVDYPSDCAECVVRVDGVDAEIAIDGQRLELRFSRLATGQALLAAYESIRQCFAASPELAALQAEW